jgi:hypothetical protein
MKVIHQKVIKIVDFCFDHWKKVFNINCTGYRVLVGFLKYIQNKINEKGGLS